MSYIIYCLNVITILSLVAAHISSETPRSDGSPQVHILLPAVITTVSVAVLLMLVGLLHRLKHKGKDQLYHVFNQSMFRVIYVIQVCASSATVCTN